MRCTLQRNRLQRNPLQNALHVATQPVVRRARVAEVVRLPAKVDAVA
jgi:hypothetical protein